MATKEGIKTLANGFKNEKTSLIIRAGTFNSFSDAVTKALEENNTIQSAAIFTYAHASGNRNRYNNNFGRNQTYNNKRGFRNNRGRNAYGYNNHQNNHDTNNFNLALGYRNQNQGHISENNNS